MPRPSPWQQGEGAFGGAHLELIPSFFFASRARLIINDLFLIRLFCPSQRCSSIFGTEVSGNAEGIGKRMNYPPPAWVAWK